MRLVITDFAQHASERRERGFTLIEVIVACILLAIVVILLFSVLIDAFRDGERARQRSKAQRNVTLSSEKLDSDLRAMRAPARNPKDVGGLEMMRESFTLTDQNKEIHDIVLAEPDRLIFYAELDSVGEAGTVLDMECVEWFVTPVPDQALHRRVYPYSPNCQGAVAKTGAKLDEEVVPKPDAKYASDKDFDTVFSYYVTEPGATPNTCTERKVEEVPALGAASLPTNPEPGQVVLPGLGPQLLDRIIAVEMDLRSFVSLKDARGESHFTQKVSIASRQQFEFRYAIGCAE